MDAIKDSVDRVVTISRNGTPLLSYRPDGGRIATPGTMPWALLRQIGDAIGFAGRPVGLSWDDPQTTEPSPGLFVNEYAVTVQAGHADGPNVTSFLNADEVDLTLVATCDYRRTA